MASLNYKIYSQELSGLLNKQIGSKAQILFIVLSKVSSLYNLSLMDKDQARLALFNILKQLDEYQDKYKDLLESCKAKIDSSAFKFKPVTELEIEFNNPINVRLMDFVMYLDQIYLYKKIRILEGKTVNNQDFKTISNLIKKLLGRIAVINMKTLISTKLNDKDHLKLKASKNYPMMPKPTDFKIA